MKKIQVLLFAAGATLFTACKEKGPEINFGSTAVASDTTYVTSVPAAQKRVVLAEEFTGATCPNCPAARDLLANLAAPYNGQVVSMELHANVTPQASPAVGAKYDLRTEDATNIAKTFYSDLEGIPSGGISRKPVNTKYTLFPTSWGDAIAILINTPPVVNVSVKSSYDASSKNATIKVTATYSQPVAKKQFLTLAILEDNLVDIQELPGSFDNNYTFKHTLRDIVTSISGDEFLKDMPTKEPGRVYERTFVYNVNGAWNPDNCKVVAFVHDNDADSKEVLQVAETELKGQ